MKKLVISAILSGVFILIINADEKTVDKQSLGVSPKDAGARMLGVTGTFNTIDSTLLAVGDGRTVEAHLITEDDIIYGPIIFWISSAGAKPLMIDSIASMNAVLSELQKHPENNTQELLLNYTISLARQQSLLAGKATGITLVGTYQALFLRLLKRVVSAPQFESINKIVESPPPNINEVQKTWRNTWVEIDRLGGAERVTASGVISPWQIKRIDREAVLEGGSIPLEVLSASLLRSAR